MDVKHEMRKQVKAGVAKVLKPLGFSTSSTKCFRRKSEQVVHVINIEFYTSANDAAKYNCSACGFSIQFGIFYDFIPQLYEPVKNRNPDITDCALRRPLSKIIVQSEYTNRLIWSANSDLSDLSDLISDATSATQIALPWFEYLSNVQNAYEVISTSPEDMKGTWGQGNPGSPLRLFYKAFVAKQLGKKEEALRAFRKLEQQVKKLDLPWELSRFTTDFVQEN